MIRMMSLYLDVVLRLTYQVGWSTSCVMDMLKNIKSFDEISNQWRLSVFS